MNKTIKWQRVSIIIVLYNSKRFIKNCLNSIKKINYPKYEIIAVDNASNDGAPQLIKNNYPKVRLILCQKNLGFAGAVNLGTKKAKGSITVMLNPDTVVQRNWLKELVKPLILDKKVGITGSKILFGDKKTIQSAGGYLDTNGLTHHFGYKQIDKGQFDQEKVVDYVTGASLAFKKNLMDEIGYLDPNYYPAYYEEIELCFKARKMKYKVVYVPKSIVYHFESQSTKLFSFNYYYWYHKHRLRFVLKNYQFTKILFSFIPSEIKWLFKNQMIKIYYLIRKDGNELFRKAGPEFQALSKAYLIVFLSMPSILFARYANTNY